ncbi:hypothetical protein FACS1894110_02190 [Spirochaetia bacterium]|nr:hypothetical protein FACS1894110_02190 [Spirochaetia bacterium]
MPVSLKKLRRLSKVDTSNVTIEPVPETYLHQEIASLGKATFATEELKRWDFMDTYGNFNTEVSVEEITNHIWALRDQFKKEHAESFFNEQKDTLIHTVVDRFALGGIMAKGDKTGGNVTTVHNAQQKIYAKEEDTYNRATYDRGKNSEGKAFAGQGNKSVGSEFTQSQLKNGYLTDAYTGKKVKGDTTSPDHIYSLSEYHKNGGFMQNDKQKADFATDTDNLASTDRGINKSLLDSDKKEWMERKSSGRDVTNEEYYEVDRKRVEEKVKQGDETAKKHLPNNREKAVHYTKNTAVTGVTEGAKMGGRQMIAAFIREIINAIFDEIRDCCSRVKKLGGKWYNGLLDRLKRIGMRIANKWKQILEEGVTGFVSGFCSNIVTVIINIFVTTAKNIVRLIREGFFSVVKAIKMLINPPADMSKSQLFHEVGKIIITGCIVTFGILAEEAIDKFPPMAVIKRIPIIGELLTDVLLGLLIALVTALALWGWDKLDIFGYKKEMQHKFVMDTLERERQEADDRYKKWLESIKQTDERRYALLCTELGLT